MKNCTYCHQMLEDDMQFCPNCGAPVPKSETVINGEATAQASEPVFTAAPVTPAAETKYNGFSIAGLVLGILSVCCCCANPLFSILAIVFGAISLSQIGKSGAKGKGLAVTALVLGIVTLILFVTLYAIGSFAEEGAYEFYDYYADDFYGDFYDDYYDHDYDSDFDFDDFLGELGEI